MRIGNMRLEEYLKYTMEEDDEYYHKVIWYINALQIGKEKYSIGYCTYGNGIAFVTKDSVVTLLIDNVRVNQAYYCSDARWCINESCPLSEGKYSKENPLRGKIDTGEIEEKLERIGFKFDDMIDRIAFEKPVIKIQEMNGE